MYGRCGTGETAMEWWVAVTCRATRESTSDIQPTTRFSRLPRLFPSSHLHDPRSCSVETDRNYVSHASAISLTQLLSESLIVQLAIDQLIGLFPALLSPQDHDIW